MEDREVLERFEVTEEQLDRWEADAAQGVFRGEPREGVVMGRPRIADEPLRAITITMPVSMVAAIDARTKNRSEFIRRAVANAL